MKARNLLYMVAVSVLLIMLPVLVGAVDFHVPATVTVNPFVHSIDLDDGWNLFSPYIRPAEAGTNRELTLKQGWNMIGYSSTVPMLWDNAVVDNGTMEMGVKAASYPPYEWLQYTIYYYDDGYKLIPDGVTELTESRGYWIYVFEDALTLKLPGVGGALVGNEEPWTDALVYDGLDTKTIEEAHDDGWVQLTIYYFDENMQGYQYVPRDDPNVDAWRGYWLYAKQPGLELLIES